MSTEISLIRIFWQKRKNSWWGRILKPLANLYRRIASFTHVHRLGRWMISGKIDGELLKIFFAGRKNSKAYISDLAFGKESRVEFLGNVWSWMIPLHRNLMRRKSHIAILEMKKEFKRHLRHGFFVPIWVNGDIDLLDKERLRTKNRQNDMRKIRKYGLSYEIVRDKASIEEFYNAMYLPYTIKAHGEAAVPTSPEEMRSAKWNWELLLVKKEGEPIGGTLIQTLGHIAHLWGMGVKDADNKYLKFGLCGAIDHFSEEHLRKRGFERMNYGGSRAFLKDGLLNYKKYRGLCLRDFTTEGFFISIFTLSQGLQKFFLENPFLYAEKDKLIGAVFVEAEKLCRELVTALYRQYFIAGMSRLNIFAIGSLPDDVSFKSFSGEYEGELEISALPGICTK